MIDTIADLQKERKALLAERKEAEYKWEHQKEVAEEVFDLIFNQKFKAGGEWLKRVKTNGKKYNLVTNLLGGVRHLYAYLHSEKSVHSATDRRGPNSIVQGPASNLGYIGGYYTRKLIWNFFESEDIDLGYFQCNAIHDATVAECWPINVPLCDYLSHHGYTTLVHRWMRDVMEFPTIISFEMDCHIGASEAYMYDGTRWDDQVVAIRKSLEWKRYNLGSKLPIERIMKIVEHNAEIIFDIRQREIKRQLKLDEQVSYYMEMTKKNCLNYGLIFEMPKESK